MGWHRERMTNELASLLTTEIERFDSLVMTADGERWPSGDVLDDAVDMTMSCTFEAALTEPGANGPSITAHAEIAPGGLIGHAWIEAQYGHASETGDIEPGSGLHRALGLWFTNMWDSWDEVPLGTPGEALGVCVSDLVPGDRLVRLDFTVARLEDNGGNNTAGERVLTVHFEEVSGTEVWPADRTLTIIRNAPRDGAENTYHQATTGPDHG